MAAGFTKTDVERLATLARLALTDEEKQLFEQQLGSILDYAEQVCQLDTAGVAATAGGGDLGPGSLPGEATRADEVASSLAQPDALRNAPDPAPSEGLFKVPRVLGG